MASSSNGAWSKCLQSPFTTSLMEITVSQPWDNNPQASTQSLYKFKVVFKHYLINPRKSPVKKHCQGANWQLCYNLVKGKNNISDEIIADASATREVWQAKAREWETNRNFYLRCLWNRGWEWGSGCHPGLLKGRREIYKQAGWKHMHHSCLLIFHA